MKLKALTTDHWLNWSINTRKYVAAIAGKKGVILVHVLPQSGLYTGVVLILKWSLCEDYHYSETCHLNHLRNRDNLGIKDSYFTPKAYQYSGPSLLKDTL